MQRKLSVMAALLAVAASASAQVYDRNYVQWPNSSDLPSYVDQWSKGTLNMEDENFFISRVKPKVRFRNLATQVNQSLNATNDKRLCFWVPVGDTNSDNGCNALPNGRFDSEVFTMWSYMSHYGDWTAPHGWVPGAFADVAHKNGVGVSGVASIPFGGNSTWSNSLTNQANLDDEVMAKFLHYHGVDGLGYNSEFSGNATAVQKIAVQHETIVKYLTEKGNPVAENMWYDGTNYNGSCTFDRGLGSHNGGIFGVDGNRRASLFFNYNWGSNRTSNLGASVNYATNTSKIDPLYIYAGFNMQGNDPGTGNWEYLSQNNVSVGLWGAHANNMLWLNRNSNGSTPSAMQRTYLTNTERYFTNGAQNPAVKFTIANGPCHMPVTTFFGMSAMMSAKSTLCWDLAEEPFVTFFNIGNGAFFNWMGERQNNNQWSNIGVQDYLPTWRYWWATELLSREVEKDDVALNAQFTWDDAYVGGSCLNISGTQSGDAFLHLFKTQFGMQRNDVISVTYKLNRGAAKVSLVLTTEGDEATALTDDSLLLFDTDAEADDELWVTREIPVSRSLGAQLNGKNLALIALKIEGAEGVDFNLGQLSLKRGSFSAPATPEVKLAKVLRNHYLGIDAKLIWNMPNNAAKDEPVYNLDVKTSLFKLYAQEENGEPILMGATSSWAGLFYSAPLKGEGRVRFGVSAVSLDFTAESEIAWSEYMERGEYNVSNDIEISKTTLKPGEGFTVRYVDSRHSASDWTIYNNEGKLMDQAKGTTEISVPNGYQEIGGYDVVINEGTSSERRYGYFIQVSAPETGAMPEIYSITVNGEETEAEEVLLTPAQTVELAYTGRDADGAGSRGLQLNEKLFGVSIQELGIQANQSFSVAGWVKITNLPDGMSSFVTVENRAGAWPANNWDFFWSRISDQGKFVYDQVDTAWGMRMGSGADGLRYWNQYDDAKIGLDSWTHFAIVFEYNGTAVRSMFYLNGVKQTMTNWLYCESSRFKNATGEKNWDDLSQVFGQYGFTYGTNTAEPPFQTSSYPVTNAHWISIGGTASNISAIDGIVDDFQVWGKAMTDEDVKASMNGLDPENLPADLLGLWDFESDPAGDHSFAAKGKKAGAKGYAYEFNEGVNEGTAGKEPYDPAYSVGCPFISGSAYKVETLPTWTAKRATIENAEGTGAEGHATLSYRNEGIYNVTLTLSNAHGSDSATFPVFNVDETNRIEAVGTEADMNAYTVGRTLFIEVEGQSAYNVSVVNASAIEVARASVPANSDRVMRVDLGSAGVYVINVTTADGAARTIKLLAK
ncbi:MAG: secretion protein [Muribaculaceae bacterium]|nr:secretion protein [Muribaculaceae bacterium]